MYPLEEGQLYLRNQWYIVAKADEISRSILERRILGEPIALYRTGAGESVAMAGLCPHRLFPFAKGRLVGDEVECGYHGFTFDRQGKCVHIPSQEKTPSRFRLRTYPLVERWDWVWIWMGDPASANAELIPDHGPLGLGVDGWAGCALPRQDLQARYTLLIDNLLDLTHVGFVHGQTVGEAVPDTSHSSVFEDGGKLCVQHKLACASVAGFEQFLFPGFQGAIWKIFQSDYYGPNLVNAKISWFDNLDGAWGKELGTIHFLHGITPATPQSTHYFSAAVRNFRIDDERLTAALCAQTVRVIAQDIEALALVEVEVDAFGDTGRELSAAADAGALRVRRKLIDQIRAEGTPSRPLLVA